MELPFDTGSIPSTEKPPTSTVRVAMGGFGAIGARVAQRLDAGKPGLQLVAIACRDRSKAAPQLAAFREPVPIVQLGELAEHADVVVEAIPADHFLDIAPPTIDEGRTLISLSSGAMIQNMDLVERTRQSGARIIVPTGGLVGLDAVSAVSESAVQTVVLETRKPPAALKGAPYLTGQNNSLNGLGHPLRVFEGSASESAAVFPAKVNVSAALSLARIGPDRTRVTLWADPGLKWNMHRIEVRSDSASIEMTIQNIPAPDQPPNQPDNRTKRRSSTPEAGLAAAGWDLIAR